MSFQCKMSAPDQVAELIANLGATEAIRLVGHKKTPQREVWVWTDPDGQGYVSKIEGTLSFGWKLKQPNSTAEVFMTSNSIPAV